MSEFSGFFNVNKPEEVTSHDVTQEVRKALDIKRVGHTGTLDPFATGVLVLAVGKATKLIEYLIKADKSYRAVFILGRETDTYDLTGQQTALYKSDQEPRREDVRGILKKFRGNIQQIPPMYSALKKDGQKLYELARAGKTIKREPRNLTISKLELVEYSYPLLRLEVNCSSGTYIRSLAHDIGQELGTGAYVHELMRTAVGKFKIADSVPPEAITADNPARYLIKSTDAIDMPTAKLTAPQINQIKTGKDIYLPQADKIVLGLNDNEEVAAILEKNEKGLHHPKKMLL